MRNEEIIVIYELFVRVLFFFCLCLWILKFIIILKYDEQIFGNFFCFKMEKYSF